MNTIHRPTIRRGFTLIEVIAALAIIGLGLVGILSLFPVGIDASKRAGDLTNATILGQSVLDQIRSAAKKGELTLQEAKTLFEKPQPMNFDVVPDRQKVIPIEDEGNPYIPKVAANTLYQYQVKFEDLPTKEKLDDLNEVGLRKVTLTVSWPANEPDLAFRNRVSLVTFIKFATR